MTYQYIPNPNDKLSKSQADIKSDFTLLDTTIGTNHFPPTAASNAGKHKFVEMVNQTIPTTAALEGSLYTKQATSEGASNQSQMFYTSDAGAQEYQITRSVDGKIAKFGTMTGAPLTGWTFLPGGLLLQYGYITLSAKGTATPVTFPITFTNVVYCITLGCVTNEGNSPGENNYFVKDGTQSASGFSFVNSSSSAARTVYWMALGK